MTAQNLIILLTVVGIAALYGLADWFGPSALVAFVLLLPVILGQSGLALWRSKQQRAGRLVDARMTDRWAKWLTITYLIGGMMASLVIEWTRLPTSIKAPELSGADREALTDCRVRQGDSVQQVKAVFGSASAPQRLDKVTPAGTAYQYHFEQDGVWVFFDERLTVTGVRLDAPFRGRLGGIAIGDSADLVRSAKGPPARQFQGLGVVDGSGSPRFATAWVYDPGSPYFIRYDILDGKVRSIRTSSCVSG